MFIFFAQFHAFPSIFLLQDEIFFFKGILNA